MKCILVPIDFSVHSKDALAYAVPIARKFGASLLLAYVVEPTVYPNDFGTNYGLQFGIPNTNGPDPLQSGFPNIGISGYTGFGVPNWPEIFC